MKLKGKAQELFEEWWSENHDPNLFHDMDEISFSMQWGVYVDFFQEHGVYILINTNAPEGEGNWIITLLGEDLMCPYFEHCEPDYANSRQEARTEALEKANKIINDK